VNRFPTRWSLSLLLWCSLIVPTIVWAQPAGPSLHNVFVRASRVALLPFVNWAEAPGITTEVMVRVRAELIARSVDLADSAQVAAVLRKHRIRNTAELTVEQIQKLSSELDVSYLLVGTIDYVARGDSTFEIALSARLLYLPTIEIVWSSCASAHSDDTRWPLAIGRTTKTAVLMQRAVARLFHAFRYAPAARIPHVTALALDERSARTVLPCRTMLVLPFANETTTKAAGFMVANLFVSELLHEGYTIVEPGRVKDLFLSTGNLPNGEIPLDLLTKCRADLAVDFVLTGSVYRCAVSPAPDGMDDPSLAVDVRIIDTRDGVIRWAKSRERAGSDALSLFGFGTAPGMGSLSRSVVRRLTQAIPHLSRPAAPQTIESSSDAR
jgi:TolB-like protein